MYAIKTDVFILLVTEVKLYIYVNSYYDELEVVTFTNLDN